MFNKQQAAKLAPTGGKDTAFSKAKAVGAIGNVKKKKPSFFGKAFEKK